ncbi:LexA family transcriptional regulator [Nitrosomonas sp. Nm34]|uniref:LexA family protein n=1 Tax=Nitrosomonas sp. Nm34 TaxID=1881055 RepID=UPI001C319694|nr:LexA family transcriptional regulator [Nitrosomonas sp. Nm34]
METFGKRIQEARKEMGLTQPQLAKLAGLSQTTISDIERGRNSGSGAVTALARVLKVNPEWLAEGRRPKRKKDSLHPEFIGVEIIEANTKGVPLISWVQAGNWSEAINNFAPGDAKRWVPCPAQHSERTFALRVSGISMFNPSGEKSFRDGDIIYVDPARHPCNGSFVVARLDDSNEVTFKQLIIEGDHKYLRAINPDWPNKIIQINSNATICGVVIYVGRDV